MIRVGICGLGFMGRTHFTNYERHRDVRVVALMDRDATRRQGDWGQQLGNLPASWPKRVNMRDRRAYRSVEELIADDQIDLVDICLPTNLHAEAAVKALQAGKHVLSEKPMALTGKECQRIVRAAGKAKGYYMVAQCVRFWPQYVKIKQLVASKRFGNVRSAALRRLAATPGYSSNNWMLRHKLSGVDHVEALWDYGKGVLVALEGGWSFQPGYPFHMGITVRCEQATAEWVMAGGEAVKVYHRSGRVEQITVRQRTGWEEEIDYFLNCIRRKRAPRIVTARSSAEAIRMAEVELKSVHARRIIPVR